MAATVSDTEVQSIIDQAIDGQPLRHGETITHRVSRAWQVLKDRRRKLEPLSLNLAAAEHYMYARFLAGTSGDPSVKIAPTLYAIKKSIYFALKIEHKMATSHQPVLPPNAAVERWGVEGANSGLADYAARTGKPAKNYGRAVSTLVEEAKRYN